MSDSELIQKLVTQHFVALSKAIDVFNDLNRRELETRNLNFNGGVREYAGHIEGDHELQFSTVFSRALDEVKKSDPQLAPGLDNTIKALKV